VAPPLQLAVVGASAASLVQATSTETSSASVPEISTVAQTLVPSPFEHAPKSPTPDVIDSTIGCFGGTIVDGIVVDGVVTTAPMGSRRNSTPPNTTGSGPSPTDTALSHTSTLNNGPSNKPPSSPSRLDHPDSYPTAALSTNTVQSSTTSASTGPKHQVPSTSVTVSARTASTRPAAASTPNTTDTPTPPTGPPLTESTTTPHAESTLGPQAPRPNAAAIPANRIRQRRLGLTNRCAGGRRVARHNPNLTNYDPGG